MNFAFTAKQHYHPALLLPFFYVAGGVVSAILPSAWRKARGVVAAYSAFLAAAAGVITLFASPLADMRIDGWFGALAFTFSVDFTSALFAMVLSSAVFVYFVYHYSDSNPAYTTLYLLSAASSISAVAAGDFFTLLFFWGLTLALLYLILQKTDETTGEKALFILGAADFVMLLGIVLLSKISLTYNIQESLMKLPQESGKLVLIVLFAISLGAVAKSGAMPFHNWIISSAKTTPDVGALILFPAIIDKALGIYLLVRILPAMAMRMNFFQPLLVIIGGATLIVAVFNALAQHNLRKLLAYHSISQVGYMILGLASFNPVGILGGIFHMINNIVYKSGLFMGAGAVEETSGTIEMSELSSRGGYARKMPRTFASMLVSSMAISGIPPMNGFVSKWLIFQGLLLASDSGGSQVGRYLLLATLFVAMLGSSLTLASFIKVIHSIFLTPSSGNTANEKSSDTKLSRWLPQAIMAFVSVLLGIGATFYVGIPILGETSLAALLIIIIAIVGGVVLYQFKIEKIFRRSEIFFGGEKYQNEYVFAGGNFYKTVEELPLLAGTVYGESSSEKSSVSDGETVGLYGLMLRVIRFLSSTLYYGIERIIYLLQNLVVKLTEGLIAILRAVHTGELYLYLAWYLVAAALIMWIFIK